MGFFMLDQFETIDEVIRASQSIKSVGNFMARFTILCAIDLETAVFLNF